MCQEKTYAPYALHPVRRHMCLHWSSPVSSSALYCKCIQCGVCLCIAMWARGYHTPWLVLHSSWPCPIATCPLNSSAIRYIVRLLQGSRMVSHLSGSPFLTSGGFLLGCDQTGNESLVPSVWFVPFYHIHISWCLEAQFLLKNRSLPYMLAWGILW